MSHPVNISDDLVRDAQQSCVSAEDSPDELIERWARQGRVLELFLRRAADSAVPGSSESAGLAECLESVDAPEGRQRLAEYLAGRPFPHYEPVPGEPGRYLRIEADGTRAFGRFVDRQFETEN